MDAFLRNLGPDHVVGIAYHMNWPGAGNDPFYVRNSVENTARRTYYGINGVPNLKCDGILGNTASQYQTYYNQRYLLPSPVDIALDITVGQELNIAASITADNSFSGSGLKLRLALIAKAYDIGPGSWTYTHFEWGMLDMVPDANGLTFNITPSQTVTLNSSCPIPTITGLDNMAIVAFVQNETTKEVLNAKYGPIPLNFPQLTLTNSTVEDPSPGGNGNGFPEPGEDCDFWVTLTNGQIFAAATGVQGTLSTTDPNITILDDQASFPDIGSGASGSNQADPFRFRVSQSHPGGSTTLRVDITANGGTYTNFYEIPIIIGIVDYLLVDDDGGEAREVRYSTDLDFLGVVHQIWDVQAHGAPPAEELIRYRNVIWFTSSTLNPLNQEEQNAIAGYLDSGKHLFITSENLNDQLGTTGFFSTYMHAQTHLNFVSTNSYLTGVTGDPISNNTHLVTYGDSYLPVSPSSIIPAPDAVTVYTYDNPTHDIGGLRHQGYYWLVYFAFPFEAVSNINPSYTPRRQVLRNIVDWFALDLRPRIQPSPGTLVFPDLHQGETDSLDLTIYNLGEADLILVFMQNNLTTIFSNNWDPVQNIVAPGDSLVFQVIFTPQDTVEYLDTLVIYSNDVEARVSLQGRGLPAMIVNDRGAPPQSFTLKGPIPNPFNPQTSFELALPAAGAVEISVHNLLGEKVAQIHSGILSAGWHRFSFDGGALSSGIYLLKAVSPQGTAVSKMVLMK